MRRPHGGAVCLSLPTAARASPFKLGEGLAGSRRASGRWGARSVCACAVCVRSAPCGVVSLGAKGGRCWGARCLVGPRFPSPQTWCRRAYCARPFSTSRSQWRRAVMVGAASLESVIPRMSSLRVAD